MKEVYFTSETLVNESEKILEEISCNNNVREFDPGISNSVLLVLDMQEFFLNPSSHAFVPSSPAIINGINELIYAFRKKNLPVIFTKHINTVENAGQLKIQWNDLITLNNPLNSIAPVINVGSSIIIEKTQYDAFYNTDLEKLLRTLGCDTVVICGVMTHLCCESTARSAFINGFNVVMPVDGTASYNRKFHVSSLYNLSHGFAFITRIKDIINGFEEKKN